MKSLRLEVADEPVTAVPGVDCLAIRWGVIPISAIQEIVETNDQQQVEHGVNPALAGS